MDILLAIDWAQYGYFGLFVAAFLAATIVPFSSEVVFTTLVVTMKLNPWVCVAWATLGNWLGSVLTYWIGWIGRWEWIEKWFKVKPETLQKQKSYVDKYGVWLALVCWVPFIGDVIAIALGFYKTRPVWTIILLLAGKFARFLVWNMLYGLL